MLLSALIWFVAAAGAMSLVGLASTSDPGRAQIARFLSGEAAISRDMGGAQAISPETMAWLTGEISRLRAETQRMEQDRRALADQLARLEAELGPVTGSIPATPPATGRQTVPALSGDLDQPVDLLEAVGLPAPILPPAGDVDVRFGPLPVADLDDMASLDSAEDAVDAALAGMATDAARTSPARLSQTVFGIDLGTAGSLDAARGIWAALATGHEELLGGLAPMIAVDEGDDGALRLRLLAGPFVDAADAARLCEQLRRRGVDCRAAPYEGQRLALR